MGSDLYRVRVLDQRDETVRLGVQVIHPDAMDLPADRSFALMMLFEAVKPGDPLEGEMGFDESIDPKWTQRHAAGLVTKVEVHSIENLPPDDLYDDPYWKNPDQWMRGEIEITVTHAAWIQHLQKDHTWASRAFKVAPKYDRCAPIVPTNEAPSTKKKATSAKKTNKAKAEPASDPTAGFVLVPSEVFFARGREKAPRTLLQMPAHGEGAYRATETRTGEEEIAAALKEWEGRAVELVGFNGKCRGALFDNGEHQSVVRMTANGSSFTSGVYNVKSIGLLELKPKARLGDTLRYETFLSMMRSRVVAMERAGAKVELTLQLPPLGKLPWLAHSTDALGVLTFGLAHSEFEGAPLTKASFVPAANEAPIVVAAFEDKERLGIEWDGGGLCAAIADGYVREWNLALPELDVPDLDTADHATVRAFLERPRPTATLTMTMSDPAWLAHLDTFEPYDLPGDGFRVGKADRWEGPPRTA
jgi:hypothetical protein